MSVFGEIKRRKVFQVAAVYAVVAWLLVQIIVSVEAPLSLPEWTDTFVIVVLAVGFPVALILAWAFDLTPAGIRRESDVHVQDRHVAAHAGGQWLNYVLQGLVLVAVGFLIVDQYVLEPGSSGRVVRGPSASSPASSVNVRRWAMNLGATEPINEGGGLRAHLALSPDGRRLAYVAQVDGTARLYLRELDQFEARAMPGTEGALSPFFSPDGERVGFYTAEPNAHLMSVSVRGGAPQRLADALYNAGGSWVVDDIIVFGGGDNTIGRRLFRIPARGGTPEFLIPPEPDNGQVLPEVLPGGSSVLFVMKLGPGGNSLARDGSIAVLSLETNEVRSLVEAAHTPRYAPTGHIVFVRGGDLWAVPFDPDRLETTGPEVPVITGVAQNGFVGGAAFTFSKDGLLVYAPGTDVGSRSPKNLMWVDREGVGEALNADPEAYWHPRLSPDGRQLAVAVTDGDNAEIWINDLENGTRNRLTVNPGADWNPVWTPDGERIVFWSGREDEPSGLFMQAANGAGQAVPLTTSPTIQIPYGVAPDGSKLLFQGLAESGDSYLYVLTLDGDTIPERLLEANLPRSPAALSPNGRWIAYNSDQTGEFEVYVSPFPIVDDTQWLISTDGGTDPLWNPAGPELFYRDDDALMVVQVDSEEEVFAWRPPEVLFTAPYFRGLGSMPDYDISPDGQRFLMMRVVGANEQTSGDQTVLVAVENWFEELNRLAPPSD